MKKIVSLVLALVLALSLVACGGNNNPGNSENPGTSNTPEIQEPSFGKDLTAFYGQISTSIADFPAMMDLAADGETLEVFYPGLKDIETKQLVVVTPMISAVAMDFAFVEVANSSDVEAVKAILQARIDSIINNNHNYPNTLEVWSNHSEIVVIDNYVCLFATYGKDALVDSFRNGTELGSWYETPVDLWTFYDDITYSYGEEWTADTELSADPELLEMIYPGLKDIETTQLIAVMPSMSMVVSEMVLVQVANAEDVAAVRAILQARIDLQIADGAWYPESVEVWENHAQIVENGNYLMLIAHTDADYIADAFNWLFV